ncbi:hypothetical protein TL16_g04705, partial [Triparma laevis f. inornata]
LSDLNHITETIDEHIGMPQPSLGNAPSLERHHSIGKMSESHPLAPLSNLDLRKLSFIFLVLVSVAVQLMYKFSQKSGGGYEYNTMSSMAITELVKFLMACYAQRSIFKEKCGDLSVRQFLEKSVEEIKLHSENSGFLKVYIFLGISYAVGNQMVFKIMHVADPGILSLIKSTAPMLVAAMNFLIYRKTQTVPQMQCVILLLCGLIAVTNPPCDAKANTYTFFSFALMGSNTLLSAVNSVINANALKELKMSMPMQNMVLYMIGFAANLVFYWFTSSSEGFFHGFGSVSVWVLIFLNATNGLAINAVYKYGDAVLKTFSQPLCSALLVGLSWAFFGMYMDRIKFQGAVTVVITTYMYIQSPKA